ncbi:MAG: redoxin domain-containing protein [Thalassobaculales bacterium]
MAVRAPEIDQPGITWLNTPHPLSLAALRGRMVILDFWTYCCINCMHVLPTLARLEAAYPDTLAVIGVHSPKFPAERDPANLRQAIARYGIAHPVAHDPGFLIWRSYAIRAWPTLVVVAPDGQVLGQHSGEPDPERLVEVIGRLIEDYRREGRIIPGRLPPPPPLTAGRLRFPGKVKPDGAGGWLVADAGNGRVVRLDRAGTEIAAWEGFAGPEGVAATAQAIYVADTRGHAIWRIEPATGARERLAGDGSRGMPLGRGGGAALASPWDLALDGQRLYFANAGTHQLGVIDLATGGVAPLAGSGAEAIVDGPAAEAALAQPSGLALSPDGTRLAFADSETSAVRLLHLAEGRVETLAGSGLFDYGHVNGPLGQARFQHCLGLAWLDDARLVVADSYNQALRVVDIAAGTAADLDDGFLCEDAVCLPLAEPAGVWAEDGMVMVADTNNHRILAYDLAGRRYRSFAA